MKTTRWRLVDLFCLVGSFKAQEYSMLLGFMENRGDQHSLATQPRVWWLLHWEAFVPRFGSLFEELCKCAVTSLGAACNICQKNSPKLRKGTGGSCLSHSEARGELVGLSQKKNSIGSLLQCLLCESLKSPSCASVWRFPLWREFCGKCEGGDSSGADPLI